MASGYGCEGPSRGFWEALGFRVSGVFGVEVVFWVVENTVPVPIAVLLVLALGLQWCGLKVSGAEVLRLRLEVCTVFFP